MSDGPDPGTVIVAIFLIVFGVCFALVGGGCTLFLLGNIGSWGSDGGMILMLLAVSLVALAIGIFMVRGALKMLGPRNG
jgi:vacuolar-type H+-ATPase subunit I/STV1